MAKNDVVRIWDWDGARGEFIERNHYTVEEAVFAEFDGMDRATFLGAMVVRVNMAIEGFENMASELAKARQSAERLSAIQGGGYTAEDAARDARAMHGPSYSVKVRIGAGAEKPNPKPVETEGDRLARFFATSAHEGHEQVRAEPERDELGAMIDSGPRAAVRGDRAGDQRASAVFHDWGETCLAVEMRRQDERRLAAALARIPNDFDLLPDAE